MPVLTQHTARRIQDRKLALGWIEATLAAPDWSRPDPEPGLTRSFRRIPEFGLRVLRVVHRQDGADIIVVTAFFDRNAKP